MSHEVSSARKLWFARLLPHIFILPIASFIPFLPYAMQLSFSSFLMICCICTFNHYISHMRELHLHDVLVVLICREILLAQEVPYSLRYILSFSFFLMNLSTSKINIFLPFFYRFSSHLINPSFNIFI